MTKRSCEFPVLWLIIMALYLHLILLSLSILCSYSKFAVRDSTLQFRNVTSNLHATLKFHNATLKFDYTTLVSYATFQLCMLNLTPIIRHAQLSL